MRFLSSLLVLSALLLVSCLRDGEKLAEFQGGSVTRRELRLMFQIFQGADAQTAATVEAQDQALRTYALMKITAMEARAEGLDKDPVFRDRTMLLEEQAALTAFDIYLKSHSASRKLRMFDMQFLILGVQNRNEGPTARRAEAQDLLGRLNAEGISDEEIERIISTKSENMRYRALGGYLDPHCADCQPNPLEYLTGPLMNVTDRKFVLVETPQGLWLVRKIKDYSVDIDDLEDAFTEYHRKTQRLARTFLASDQAQQPQAKEFFQSLIKSEQEIESMAREQAKGWADRTSNSVTQNRLDALKKEHSLDVKPEAVAQENPNPALYQDSTVLFVLDGHPFTYGQLKTRTPSDANLATRLQLLTGVILPYELIKNDSELADAKKEPVYEFYKELNMNEALSRAYFMKHSTQPVVGEDRIRQEYELRKFTEYQGKSYMEVRAAIAEQLKNTDMQRAALDMQQKLMEKYGLHIDREALKPGRL